MFVIFLMGMFTRRAKSLGVIYGAVISLCVMWYLSFFAEITLNFKWTSTLGFVISLTSCYGLSLYQSVLTSVATKGRKLYKAFTYLSVVCIAIAILFGLFPIMGSVSFVVALLASAATVYFYGECAGLSIDAGKLDWTFREQRKTW
jgi:hypothetical protein